ncbi:MAG TPA: hypothetical protein VM884_05835 [Flavisolibacter sp.]|nr:hypothetical protein [Flavisolibacter sp.]
MITGIKKQQHGFTDYSYIPLVMAAPKLVGFTGDKAAATVCRAMSLTVLGYTLLTDAKWGAYKLIPYRTHAVLDLSSGVASLAAPWVLRFSANKKARNTLLLMGLTGLVVGTLSLIGAKRS